MPGKYRMYFTSNHDENSWEGTVYQQLGKSAEVFAVMSQTLYGMPLVYSGQEAGLNKRLEFFYKDEIDWSELPLENLYSQLQNLKLNNSALWNGNAGGMPIEISTSDTVHVFCFLRQKDEDEVLVFLNLSSEDVNVSITENEFTGDYKDVFSNEAVSISSETIFNLEKWKYKVFYK